jgi:ArsR family transcriptional regulator
MATSLPPLSVSEAAWLFKALGDPARLRLLLLLAEHGPMNVSALCTVAGQLLPTIANQLRVLRMTGLVRWQRQGKCAVYSLAPGHVRHFLRFIQGSGRPRGQPERRKDRKRP